MRAATQVVSKNPIINTTIDVNNCQVGIPKGNLTNMVTGEVNGKIETVAARVLPGCRSIGWANKKDNTKGIVIGNKNCCVSVSVSTAAPTIANKAAYNR